jgi:hypothetical protein
MIPLIRTSSMPRITGNSELLHRGITALCHRYPEREKTAGQFVKNHLCVVLFFAEKRVDKRIACVIVHIEQRKQNPHAASDDAGGQRLRGGTWTERD